MAIGGKLLRRLLREYKKGIDMFRKKINFSPPSKTVKYPKWTFAKVGDNYWLVLEKTKMPFISERAFVSWGKQPVTASKESLSGYQNWKPIGFAPGSLVRSMSNELWFITGSDILALERRLVATPDFYTLGFNEKDAILIGMNELEFHKEGSPITSV